jgi:hypothetical protein
VTERQSAVLGVAEGTSAEIAWVVVYVLCWFFMIFPVVLWYAGVRTPRAEREGRPAATDVTDPDDGDDTPAVAIRAADDRTRFGG